MRIGQRILALLKEGKQFTTKQIVEALGDTTIDNVYQSCCRLHSKNRILRSNPTKSGETVVWQKKPDGMVETERDPEAKRWTGPDIDQASGDELNTIGESVGVERGWSVLDTEEGDEDYRQRIKDELGSV